MKKQQTLHSMLLLLAASIWGFAFVAQRVGARSLGAFSFNGIRFALGTLCLLPVMLYRRKKNATLDKQTKRTSLWAGAAGGALLYIASALQQLGIEGTPSSGKAAFVTGLYLALVPILGLLLGQRVKITTWLGLLFSVCGLYLLCINGQVSLSIFDIYLLLCAVFWAVHIQLIDHFAPKTDTMLLSIAQYGVCALLSLITAGLFEKTSLTDVANATIPLLYGGIGSVSIAFTLQSIGQKHVPPAHAGILLSLESVFATIGGMLILGEAMTSQNLLGCALMLTGMLIPQLFATSRKKLNAAEPLANDLG